MKALALGLFGIMVVGAGEAEAASFDCARASTPFEQAICDFPDLSEADDTLAVAWQTAIGGLSKPLLTRMQAEQKAWLGFAERSCSPTAEALVDPVTEEQAQCLAGQFRQRIGRLEQSRMQSGLRLAIADRYEVIVDSTAEPDAWNKVATFEAGMPVLDGDSDLAAAFAAFIDTATPALIGEIEETSDISRQTAITEVTAARISVTTTDYWYGHGAAHGNYAITHAHFLRAPMRALVAEDIFAGEGWQAELGKLVLAALDQSVEGGIWDDARPQVPELSADPSRWALSPEGLSLTFQPYEVTAYAAGAPMVTIPWAQLETWLAPGAVELAW